MNESEYESYNKLPYNVRRALDQFNYFSENKGSASCLESQAYFRTSERPYDEARKKEYEVAKEEASRQLAALIKSRNVLAREILAYVANDRSAKES